MTTNPIDNALADMFATAVTRMSQSKGKTLTDRRNTRQSLERVESAREYARIERETLDYDFD